MTVKIVFAGTPDVAVPALQALAADRDHFEIRAVITRPDAPVGRGRKLMPSPVKQVAHELDLPVIESDPNNEEAFIAQLRETGAQMAAVVAYGKILRQSVLDALPLGWYNLHFSLLPQWRGAAPAQRAIWAGDDITGATVFRIVRAMDAGPIVGQYTTQIGKRETSGELLIRLAHEAAPLLVTSLLAVANQEAVLVPQAEAPVSIAQKITVEDAHIHFDKPAFALDRQIRACTPHPGAWCSLHANADSPTQEASVLHILRAEPVTQEDVKGLALPTIGRLLITKHDVYVGTISGALRLLVVKAQGKKAMNAADWARGARLSNQAYCD